MTALDFLTEASAVPGTRPLQYRLNFLLFNQSCSTDPPPPSSPLVSGVPFTPLFAYMSNLLFRSAHAALAYALSRRKCQKFLSHTSLKFSQSYRRNYLVSRIHSLGHPFELPYPIVGYVPFQEPHAIFNSRAAGKAIQGASYSVLNPLLLVLFQLH